MDCLASAVSIGSIGGLPILDLNMIVDDLRSTMEDDCPPLAASMNSNAFASLVHLNLDLDLGDLINLPVTTLPPQPDPTAASSATSSFNSRTNSPGCHSHVNPPSVPIFPPSSIFHSLIQDPAQYLSAAAQVSPLDPFMDERDSVFSSMYDTSSSTTHAPGLQPEATASSPIHICNAVSPIEATAESSSFSNYQALQNPTASPASASGMMPASTNQGESQGKDKGKGKGRGKGNGKGSAKPKVEAATKTSNCTNGIICPVCKGPGRNSDLRICGTCYSGLWNDIAKAIRVKHELCMTSNLQTNLETIRTALQTIPRGCQNKHMCGPEKFLASLSPQEKCTRCRSIYTLTFAPRLAVEIVNNGTSRQKQGEAKPIGKKSTSKKSLAKNPANDVAQPAAKRSKMASTLATLA